MTIARHGSESAGSKSLLVHVLTLCLLCVAAFAGAQDFDSDGVQDNLDNCVLASNASQADADGDGWGNRCDADFNNDGVTNAIDLGYLKSVFFTNDPVADLDDSGLVNVVDLGLFKQQFFGNPGPAGFAIWVTAGDGDWEVPDNWFPAAVPPAEAHVTIDQPADITVSFPRAVGTAGADFSAASITTSDDIDFIRGTLTVGGDVTSTANLDITGGKLDVSGILSVEGSLSLTVPAELANATLTANGSGDDLVPTGNGVRLSGVTLQRDLIIGNAVQVVVNDDLTLDSVDVMLESTGSYSYLRFDNSQTLGGTGSVRFAGTTSGDNDNRIWSATSGQTLTVEAGIAIDTDTAGGYFGNTSGSIVLLGSVTSDLDGRRVRLGGDMLLSGPVSGSNGGDVRLTGTWTNSAGNTISMAGGGLLELWGDWTNLGTIDVADGAFDIGNGAVDDWVNDGSITISNSSAVIGGTALTADVLTVSSDGPITLNGTVVNTATDFNLDGLPNGVSLGALGTVRGGTVSGSASLAAGPGANPCYLDGVTMNTDLVLFNATQLIVQNDLTLNNVDVSLNSSGSFTYLRFDGDQTLGGTGNVLFAGTTSSDNDNRMWQRVNGATLTIESGITIESDTRGGWVGNTPGTIVQNGTILSDTAGRRVRIGGDTSIDGTVTATGGGDLRLMNTWVNEVGNTISITGGGLLELNDDWNNLGTITATDSDFSIGDGVADEWTNNGSITLVSSPATIGGSFDTANLHTIVSDASVIIDGNLDNTGTTFVTDTFPGGVSLGTSATVVGGTVAGTASLVGGPANPARLVGVTLSTDLDMTNAAQVIVTDGLTLDNVDVTLASSGSYSYLRFDGTQTLGGSGQVLLGGTTSSDSDNRIWQNQSGETLTIDTAITIDTVSAGGYVGLTPGSILLRGTVTSDLNGRRVRIGGNTTVDGPVMSSNGGELRFEDAWTNEAGNTISASNAGLLELNGTWSNAGTITVTNAPIDLGGSFDTAALLSITSDGNINVDGNLDNTGTTLNLDAIPNGLTLGTGSTLVGGTVTGTQDLSIAAGDNGRLDGVTLATDLIIPNASQAFISNGLTLTNSNVVLSSDGSFSYLRFDGTGMQALNGTGELRFAGTTASDSDDRVLTQNASTDLTITSGIRLLTVTAGGRIGTSGAETVIEGEIIANLDGRKLDLIGSPFTLEGSATMGSDSSINLISNGSLVLAATADIDMDVGPSTHSTMDFDDSIALDGDLNLALVDGASPSSCDLYDVFTYESFSGNFDAITGPDLGGGQTFDLILLEDLGQLQAPGSGCSYEVSRLTGNTETASSVSSSNSAARGNDNNRFTYWCALNADAGPALTVEVPANVTVASVVIDNTLSTTRHFLTGRIRLLNGSDAEVYNSGPLVLTAGDLNHDVSPDTSGVRKVIFEGLTWGSGDPCIGEIDALGTQP